MPTFGITTQEIECAHIIGCTWPQGKQIYKKEMKGKKKGKKRDGERKKREIKGEVGEQKKRREKKNHLVNR